MKWPIVIQRPGLLLISIASALAVTFAAQPPQPASAVVAGPALTIDAAAGNHPIASGIYGMNFADPALLSALHLPVNRWGGNATSRYNYLTNTSNHGSDWYFETIQEGSGAAPDDSEANRFINRNNASGAATVLTVPLLGYVATSDSSTCSFPISTYGPQQGSDWQWRPDCGNGLHPDGSPITGNDPLIANQAIDQSFVQGWVQYLNNRYGGATSPTGVKFYELDNEPDLWYETHRDVHLAGASYDELLNKGIAYASAIKAADPNAQVMGPVSWGWWGYFYSALDVTTGGSSWWDTRPDRKVHGDTPFLEWYLAQMKAYQDAHGGRLLDYLDLHFYPQTGVDLTTAGDATMQAKRLRNIRSLWDPSYCECNDGSWIDQPVMLIPRMHQWVNANYPGTKLAITEYNFGGLESVNGALAQADVLGIFGREGVDLATLWEPPTSSQPGANAFRMYLNYDGQGGHFGDTSVSAASADQGQLAVYGSKDSASGTLKLMMINKTASDQSSTVSLANFSPACAADVYRYSAANTGAIVKSSQAVASGGFTATFPANSITLMVIPAGGGSCVPPPPANLVSNASFEVDANNNRVPDGWSASNLVLSATKDSRACDVFHTGACSMRITGNWATKSLTQTLVTSGPAGRSFTFSAWSRAQNAPATSVYQAKVTVFYTNSTSVTKTVNFAAGTHDWQQASVSFVTTLPYNKIKVMVIYAKVGGTVWFDDLSLTSP